MSMHKIKWVAVTLGVVAQAWHSQVIAQTAPTWDPTPLVADGGGQNLLVDNVGAVGIYADYDRYGPTVEGVFLGAQGVTSFFTSSTGTHIYTPLAVDGQITGNLTGNVTGNLTGNVTGNVTGNSSTATFATTAGSVSAVNLTGPTLAANVVNSSLTSLGTLTALNVSGPSNLTGTNSLNGTNNLGGTNNLSGTSNLTGTNNISGTSTLSGTNILAGTNSITGATTINTGVGTATTTIGGAQNQTLLNSALNEIGNSSSYATVNHIGVGSANQSTNVIGNSNAQSTVSAFGGAGSLLLGNASSTLANGAGYATLTNSQSTLGTGTGGMVQTNASSASIRASSSGTLATNGSSGTMAVNAGGGYMAYATSQSTGAMNSIGGVVDNKTYTNKINGNTFVDGNVYINGTLDYVSSNSANTTVIATGSGASILPSASTAVAAGTAIVMKGSTGTQTVVDAHGKLTNVTGTATQATASLTLTNGIGNTHGLVVTETQATLSGGTQSSSLTMADNGATFSDAQTGSPVQVHGVNDGTADFDAVNVRQFAGAIASVTAMANIPQVDQDKSFAVGVGVGGFMGKSALAAGLSYRFTRNGVFKASLSSAMSHSDTDTVGLGVAWSF